MDKINKTTEAVLNELTTNSKKSQSTTSTQTGLPISWISALFSKFQIRYGHKFTSTIEGIEEQAVNEWAEGLAGLTGEQIANGLKVWDGDWPPSMPEFQKACTGKGINDFGLDYVPECYRETKRERLLESDENKAKHKAAYESGMKGLKEIFNKS